MEQSAQPLVVVSSDLQLRVWLTSQAPWAQQWQISWPERPTCAAAGAVRLVDVRHCLARDVVQLGAAWTTDGLAIALVQPAGVGQAVAAMRAGFYLACELTDLAAALVEIRSDMQTGAQVSAGAQALPRRCRRLLAALTTKERDVLDLVLAGLANKNVAKRLGYSLKTIEVRRQAVMLKLEVESLAELVRVAMTAEPNWQLPERLAPAPPSGAPRRTDAPAPCPLPTGIVSTAVSSPAFN